LNALRERSDQLSLVPREQLKAPKPLREVDLDHVPEDRTAADLHKRLGDRLRVLLQARTTTAAEDRDRRQHHVTPFAASVFSTALTERSSGDGGKRSSGLCGGSYGSSTPVKLAISPRRARAYMPFGSRCSQTEIGVSRNTSTNGISISSCSARASARSTA